jgi:hypothetical protein
VRKNIRRRDGSDSGFVLMRMLLSIAAHAAYMTHEYVRNLNELLAAMYQQTEYRSNAANVL